MKKDLIGNYNIFMLIIFIIENILLINLKIKGIANEIFMLILIIFNIIILVRYNNEIKFKILTIIVSFFLLAFSKDFYNFIFITINMLTLLIIVIFNAIKKQPNKIIILFILTIFLFKYLFYISLFIIIFSYVKLSDDGYNDIYHDTYYYCKNNYEAYVYSAGALDSFHYSIGKHYEIFNIDGIINVSYRERNETSKEKYEEFIKNNKCNLVGDIDGFK